MLRRNGPVQAQNSAPNVTQGANYVTNSSFRKVFYTGHMNYLVCLGMINCLQQVIAICKCIFLRKKIQYHRQCIVFRMCRLHVCSKRDFVFVTVQHLSFLSFFPSFLVFIYLYLYAILLVKYN